MVTNERYLDLDDCARLLGMRSRQLRGLTGDPSFPAPAGQDGGPFWREEDVLRWAAAKDPQLAARVELDLWPDPATPAAFTGAHRLSNDYGLNHVVLVWCTPAGRVGVLWRCGRSGTLSSTEVIGEADLAVLIGVEADFGPWGPSLSALNRAGQGGKYLVRWPDLARVLGQAVPYWPYLLRDPDLIAAWRPGTATVTAPARTDLDSYPLLRMATMFDAAHPTAKTLVNLVQIDQHRATRDARNDLRNVAERVDWATERGETPAS